MSDVAKVDQASAGGKAVKDSAWLENLKFRAFVYSEAYRLRLAGLWWLNLVLVVLPAAFSTCAAIFSAAHWGGKMAIPPATVFAGSAAILLAIHKALKCDEYQAECLRLGQAYQALGIAAERAILPPEKSDEDVKGLAEKLRALTEDAKAPLPSRHLRWAKEAVLSEELTLASNRGSRTAGT